MNSELKEALSLIPVISSDRKYWFIRTEGGRLFNLFRLNNLVAVGYGKIKGDALRQLAKHDDTKEELKKLVQRYYPKHRRPGLIVTQIYRFFYEVQKGDVVIIPSYSSEVLLFGEILDDEVCPEELFDREHEESREFELSRKVKWLKTTSREQLNPKLYSLFFSHHTISSGNDYASFIDSELNDFYIKNAIAHLIIHIEEEADINARNFARLPIELLDLTDIFLKEDGMKQGTDNVRIKINVSSPGFVELFGAEAVQLLIMGFIIMIVLSGVNVQYKSKDQDIKLASPGILKRFAEFCKQQQRFKDLEKIIKKLKIRETVDLRIIVRKLIVKDKDNGKIEGK